MDGGGTDGEEEMEEMVVMGSTGVGWGPSSFRLEVEIELIIIKEEWLGGR